MPPCLVRSPYRSCERPLEWTYQLRHIQQGQARHSPEIHDLQKGKENVETKFKAEAEHLIKKAIESEEGILTFVLFFSLFEQLLHVSIRMFQRVEKGRLVGLFKLLQLKTEPKSI